MAKQETKEEEELEAAGAREGGQEDVLIEWDVFWGVMSEVWCLCVILKRLTISRAGLLMQIIVSEERKKTKRKKAREFVWCERKEEVNSEVGEVWQGLPLLAKKKKKRFFC